MSQKSDILACLQNGAKTQAELAFAIYHDHDHAPSIYAAVTDLVKSGQIAKSGAYPAVYSLPGYPTAPCGKPDPAWTRLYDAARAVLHPRKISEWMEAGGVAAAIETPEGKIYTGVCVDSACALGICAERNAIFRMLTDGGSEICRMITVSGDGKVVPPCGACRELMAQLMPERYRDIEVMLDDEKMRVVTLGDLTPEWWI